MFYEVIPGKIFRNGAGALTYSSEERLEKGQVVVVPLGKAKVPGVVIREVGQVDFKTKPIEQILYERPLPEYIIEAIFWLAKYYAVPLPTVLSMFLPVGVMKKRRRTKKAGLSETGDQADKSKNQKIDLNPAQKIALEGIRSAPEATKLLFGITGSGKTNIYLKMAENTLRTQKSTILLVPEIALTSQLVQIFEHFFGNKIVLIHSKQTEAERHLIWEELLFTEEPKIIIGPRSALLAPVHNLGLIIIDESHEGTYYQDNSPKYSALRLASFMAKTLGISSIQGTATPLVADYYLARAKKSLIVLDKKAKKTAQKATIRTIEFGKKENFKTNRYFSDALLEVIRRNLKRKEQTLIFHNRRGSAPITLCEKCGWQALCPECFLPLTLHADSYDLHCHTCGRTEKIPSGCPECGNPSIIHKGFGTKLLETELKRLFPEARIARFDADNTKEESLANVFSEVKAGEIDILIGTQAIAKGLDLPKLASVGVVQADSGLALPDFAAEEKVFQLLTQVIGRVGRGHLETAEVLIQTYQPGHPAISLALKEDYKMFAEYLLKKRWQQKAPPYYFIGKVSVTYKTEQTALKKIKEVEQILRENSEVIVLPPMPAFHERTNRGYTWQLVVKARARAKLMSALAKIPAKIPVNLTIDPPSLIG